MGNESSSTVATKKRVLEPPSPPPPVKKPRRRKPRDPVKVLTLKPLGSADGKEDVLECIRYLHDFEKELTKEEEEEEAEAEPPIAKRPRK